MFSKRSPAPKVLGVAAGLLAVVTAISGIASGVASGPYTATFDGGPASPLPVARSLADFDVQVHSRDRSTWFTMEPMEAQHGPDCGAPPATHTNTSYEGSVFNCKNHLMTALNTSGYGVIYLTPNQIFDFANGGSITFEKSTERLSTRDWWDVLITPYEDNLSLPLLSNLSQGTDLQGPPVNTIHIGTDNGEGAPVLSTVVNGTEWNGPAWVSPADSGIPATVNQAATRQTFKFTIANGRMKFERLASATAPALVFWDVAATVPFTSGVVQFGHHSYNPSKCDGCQPGTQHWDNLTIEPATPFTLIKADRRYTQGGAVDFASPAPANAYLRFAGICQVSVDGKPVTRVPSYDRWGVGYKPEHMSSYFVPVAEGTRSVNISFGNDGWYETGHGCIAKDFSIWSKSAGSTSNPVPTSTPTKAPATSTATAVQPTQAAPTVNPTTAAPTATPTTSLPTASATPSASQPASTSPTSPGTRITWNGKSWYVHGANLPWYNWGCDFGCGSNGGASSSTVNSAVSAAFAQAKANGVNVVRWWVFPGDPWQINRDGSGAPTGINPTVYTDLDAAVALAAQHDIYLDLVLFSSPTAIPGSWVNNATHRTQLAQALGPMFARYKNNPRVMTWEVVNEPEFDIWSGKVSEAAVQAHVKAIADSVHANSPALVTVGSAMVDGLGMWVGQGLDYYQAHWYDYMQPGDWCARCTDYPTLKSRYGLDAPLVVGEFFAGPSVDSLQRFEDFYAKGFAGAWAWSLLTSRTSDGMTVDLAASKTFAGSHADLGPKASTTTQPTATPTSPAATATPTKPAATATPTTPAPTAPPINTSPTATPTNAPPQSPLSFTTSVTPNKPSITRGQKITLATKVKASASTKVLVDVEVYGPDGTKVYQKVYDNQSLSAGTTKSFSPAWSVPRYAQKGTYTVKIGIFKPGWAGMYVWSDSAATFTVK